MNLNSVHPNADIMSWPEATPQMRRLLIDLAFLWPDARSKTPRPLHDLVTTILDNKITQNNRLSKISTLLKSDPSLGSMMIKLPNCSKFHITPAMLAIFRNRLDELDCYINAGLSPSWGDNKGYTLMHYAAMIDQSSAFYRLQALGGDLSIENFVGATPRTFFDAKGEDSSDLCLYPWKVGPCVDRVFYKLSFGADYTRSSRFNSDSLLEIRMHGTQTVEVYNSKWIAELTRQYELMMSQPESPVRNVYLCEVGAADDGSEVAPDLARQHDVRARMPIPPGVVIMEYSGLVGCAAGTTGLKTAGIDKAGFGIVAVDAEKVQNLAGYINHGPPNCGFYPIISNGLPHIVIVSLREIGENERLSMDYGPQYFPSQGYEPVELCPNAIKDYLAATNDLSYFSAIQSNDGTLKQLTIDANGQSCFEVIEGAFHENFTEWTYHLAMLRYLMKDRSSLRVFVEDHQIPMPRLAAIASFLEEFVIPS